MSGKARALIVVDVQRGFVTPDTEATVSRVLEHIQRERRRYAVVIATRFINSPGSMYETEREWDGMMDAQDISLVSGIDSAVDAVLSKHGLAPDPGELLPILRGVEQVEVCGFDTDQCVLATALLLWDAGIVPRVLASLCSSSGGPDMHEAGLAIARRAIGDRNVIDTAGHAI